MNKGKRLGIIIGTSILSIILIIIFLTVAVRSSTVRKSVDLGNKYIAEGKYEEAIIAFEKAIKIDSKNTDIKETLDVLYIYEEVIELVEQGELEKAQEKLEEVKDKPKFNIVEESLEEVEDEIKSNLDGLGNSYINTVSGGLVAYDNEYVFYSNLEDDGKLYKMNIDSGESIKLCDDKVKNINIYNNYIYYMVYSELNINYVDIYEIKKISINGNENEVVVNKNENVTNFQIINGVLYYNKYLPEEEHLDISNTGDIIAINLDTMVSQKIVRNYSNRWILRKNSNNELDMISYVGYYIQINKDILNTNEVGLSVSGILGLKSINSDSIFYLDSTEKPIVYKLITNDEEVLSFKKDIGVPAILGNNNIYIKENNKLISIDKKTGSENVIKEINMKEFSDFFEVKGYLAYYDSNNRLIIDKEVNILE